MEFADGYEGVTVAGLAIVRFDGEPMVFLAQRAYDETDDEAVRETWEFVGGHLNAGEEPFAGAAREFAEEIGFPLPPGEVVGGWRSEDGHYQGFVYEPSEFPALAGWQPTSEVQEVGWFTEKEVREMARAGILRPEVSKTPSDPIWNAVSGNKESNMTEATAETEPEFDVLAFVAQPIPVHGVIAPEEVPTGDGRGFNAGAMTRRPLRLPFSDQKVSISGHDGSVVTGSVDRIMRKDNLIHWEGALMPSAETEDLISRMAFFGGRYGVSVDGDNGSLDRDRSKMTGEMWFEKVRASGLTAVAIPAFHEAYVAFGLHPDMPDDDTDAVLSAAGIASGDIVGGRLTFDRGPGWVTNPVETKRLHDYWTKKGEPGYAKIAWGTPGDWTRAVALIGAKISENSPGDMKYIKQIAAQWHFDALGYWPGELGKPGNAPDTAENRKRAAIHARSEIIEMITASASSTVQPPLSWFDRHEDTDASAILDPDPEFSGLRRVFGYVAEWGVCHIGYSGRCVEPPRTYSDAYPEFHLGVTSTLDGGEIKTGVLTYGIGHRDAETILSETPEQCHFDNVANAWAAVCLGEDERGIWYSGYVLPHVPEEDITLIKATGQVSGEWRYGALRACLAVNVPGYPVQRASAVFDDEGNVVALAACAFSSIDNGTAGSECDPEPTPAERMAAMAKIDAEERMERLRAKFNYGDVAETLMNEAQDEGRVAPVGLREDGAIVYEIDGEIPGTDTITQPMPDGA